MMQFRFRQVKIPDTPLPQMSSIDDLPKVFKRTSHVHVEERAKDWSEKFSFPMIVGSLIHAMVHTRPDIAYALSVLSRFMSKPELHHFKAANYLLRYLKGTSHIGLRYDKAEILRSFKEMKNILTGAVDSSFADCSLSARSTSGFILWYGGCALDWECKRQPLVTMSTMEAEYVAASKCVLAIRALNKLVNFVGLYGTSPIQVLEDNAACVAIASHPVHRQRSRHIAVKYHNVRDACQNREVELVQVWTRHQVADIFTKSLSRDLFQNFRDVLFGYDTKKDPMIADTYFYRDLVAAVPKPDETTKQLHQISKGCSCGEVPRSVSEYVKSNTFFVSYQVPLMPNTCAGELMGYYEFD